MIKDIHEGIKQITNIKDNSFDVDDIIHYSLNYFLFSGSLSVVVFDTRNQQVKFLEHFTFSSIENDITPVLTEVIDNHHFLSACFWKEVHVYSDTSSFVLVPTAFYEESNKSKYLSFVDKTFSDAVTPISKEIKKYKLAHLFSNLNSIESFFRAVYKGKVPLNFHHLNEVLLQAAISQDVEDTLVLTVFDDKISFVYFAPNGALEFCNLYNYGSLTDILYYSQLLFKELSLNQYTTKLACYCSKDLSEQLKNTLSKFFKQFYLGKRPESLNLGFKFSELEDFEYFAQLSSSIK